MRPHATAETGEELAAAITVLIVPASPDHTTSLFRHQVLRTLDPAERYHAALEILAADYFQQPRNFSDVLTATFGSGSPTADRLLARGRCVLAFAQDDQGYRLPCAVTELDEADPFYQATWWHNRLWNSDVPPRLRVLAFTPDWTRATRIRAG